MRQDFQDIVEEIKESKRQQSHEIDKRKKKGWTIGPGGVPQKGGNKYAWVESRFDKPRVRESRRPGYSTCRGYGAGDPSSSNMGVSPEKSPVKGVQHEMLAIDVGNLRFQEPSNA